MVGVGGLLGIGGRTEKICVNHNLKLNININIDFWTRDNYTELILPVQSPDTRLETFSLIVSLLVS